MPVTSPSGISAPIAAPWDPGLRERSGGDDERARDRTEDRSQAEAVDRATEHRLREPDANRIGTVDEAGERVRAAVGPQQQDDAERRHAEGQATGQRRGHDRLDARSCEHGPLALEHQARRAEAIAIASGFASTST